MAHKLLIQAIRGPGEKWTGYYPACYTETTVLFQGPRLLLLEKAYANEERVR